MGIEKIRRYLPQEQQTAQTELADLIERANHTASAVRILKDELRVHILENHTGSQKIFCPWSAEHTDPHDKNCRFYASPQGGHAYCFAAHGVLDPVGIRAIQWKVSKQKAATQMLEAAGLARRENWRRRLEAMKLAKENSVPRTASVAHAQAALVMALRDVPGYVEAQYTPQARKALEVALAWFDPSWGFADVTRWIEAAKMLMSKELSS